MINSKYYSLTLFLIFNTHHIFACECKTKTVSKSTFIIQNLRATDLALQRVPPLATVEELIAYRTSMKEALSEEYDYDAILEHYKDTIQETIESNYHNFIHPISGNFIQKDNDYVFYEIKDTKRRIQMGKPSADVPFLIMVPFALEYCIQTRAEIDACNNKQVLLQQRASLERAPKQWKFHMPPQNYVKYNLLNRAIARLTAEENFEYAAVDLAVFMKPNKPYYDLAEQTQLFLATPDDEKTIEDAQLLIDTALSLENPYYAIFYTQDSNNEYGLKKVHTFLMRERAIDQYCDGFLNRNLSEILLK